MIVEIGGFMSWLLVICTVFIVIAFFVFMFGLSNDEGDVISLGLASMVIIAIFGFGMFGNLIGVSSKESLIIPNEIARTKYTVFVKIEDKELTSTEARFVNAPEGSVLVKKTQQFNSYGKESLVHYELAVQED